MAAYIISNMTIHDRDEYSKYVKGFMPILELHGGSLLALQDSPPALEGSWQFDRTVILSFPSREAAQRWYQSPQYQELAKHRWAGTTSSVAVIDGYPLDK